MSKLSEISMRGTTYIAMALIVLAPRLAPGQRGVLPLKLFSAPPSPTALGEEVRLGVRPPDAETQYRYVATMSVTGSGMMTGGTACATPQMIGSGPFINWTPASGAYRLTVHAMKKLTPPESASVSYQVDPPNGGFLTVNIMQNPTPQPPGKLMLSLHTNDRGSGKHYQWVIRFTSSLGAPIQPPVYRTADTPAPFHSVPMAIPPGTYNVNVRVGIHAGDACRISETSVGTLTAQVIH